MGRRNGSKDPLNASCAKFMKDTRLKLGVPQVKAAKALGISTMYYSELERGIYKIALTDFVRFTHTYLPELTKKFPKALRNQRYIMLTLPGMFLASFINHATPTKHPTLHLSPDPHLSQNNTKILFKPV